MDEGASGATVGPEFWRDTWVGEAVAADIEREIGRESEVSEIVMLCVDRLYAGQEEQTRWRLGMLLSTDLEKAEKIIGRLLEIIKETKNKQKEIKV